MLKANRVLFALALIAVIGGMAASWLYWRSTGYGPLSSEPLDWATFGTFFGGTLGPFYAFLALLGLLHSIHLQSSELRITSSALVDSAASQSRNVELLEAQNELHRAAVQASRLSIEAVIAQLEAGAIEMESLGTTESGRSRFARDIRGLADDLRDQLGIPARHSDVPRHRTP